MVYRGKLDKPAPNSVAEHDQVSEVYHIIDGTATLVLGPDIINRQRRPATQQTVREFNGPGQQRLGDSQRRRLQAQGRRRRRHSGRHRPLVHEDRRPHRLPDGADRSRQGHAAQGRSRVEGVPVEAGGAGEIGPWSLGLGPWSVPGLLVLCPVRPDHGPQDGLSTSTRDQGLHIVFRFCVVYFASTRSHADHRRRDPDAVVLVPRARHVVADARASPSGSRSTSSASARRSSSPATAATPRSTGFRTRGCWRWPWPSRRPGRRCSPTGAVSARGTRGSACSSASRWRRRCSITGWRRSFRRSSRRRRW